MRLAWPEWVVLGLLIIEALYFVGGALAVSHGGGSIGWMPREFLVFAFCTLTPVEILLRYVDLLCAGPARRRGNRLTFSP